MTYAGIDIAKNKHAIGATDERGKDAAKPMPFANSTEGFDRCIAYLDGLADSKAGLMVGMEATGHYWLPLFCRLQDEGYPVVVVNPVRTDAMRRFKGSSRVKTDMIDCVLVAETLRCGEFEPSKLGDEAVIELRQLTRLHQELKESVADLKRQVIVALDQVFPEYDSIFSNTFGESSKAFLKRCPTPEECLGIRADSLARTLERASRGKLGRAKADEIKEIAKASCGISVAASAFSFQIKLLIDQIDFIEGQIDEAEARVRDGIEAVEPLDPHDSRHRPRARRPDSVGDRRHPPLPQRARRREVRRHQPLRQPIGQVLVRGQPHNETRVALPAPRALPGGDGAA